MGRTIGAMAAAVAVAVVVRVVSTGATSADTSAQDWIVLAPALAAAVYAVVRLLCWSMLWSRPRATPPDRRARSAAEAALDRTEVAVVCDGESLVLVRTATIAAIASTGASSRVLLVGADPRLDQLGRSLGVRRVTSGIGPRAGIAAAVAAATGEHLVLTSAASAVLPGALRPALEQFDRGTVWVQAEPVAPGDRALLDHVRHDRWWPSLDARGAMPWLGFGSIVLVEAFRTLPVARGAAACTVAAQRQGWRGRWHRPMIAVEQVDAGATRDREIAARADRLRSVRGLRSPIWARGLTRWQRLAHVATLVEDLAGLAAVTAVSAVVAALALGELPLPFEAWAWGAPIAIALAWLARLLLTGGLVRPVGMCRAATDDIAPSLRSVARSMRRAGRAIDVPAVGTSRRGWRAQIELLALVLAVDLALAWRAWQVLVTDDDARRLLTEGAAARRRCVDRGVPAGVGPGAASQPLAPRQPPSAGGHRRSHRHPPGPCARPRRRRHAGGVRVAGRPAGGVPGAARRPRPAPGGGARPGGARRTADRHVGARHAPRRRWPRRRARRLPRTLAVADGGCGRGATPP